MRWVHHTIYLVSVILVVVCYYVERVHKVHNINLYPDRHAWCEARPIKMVIGHDGCETHTIDNKVCVGQCFSYSVPKTIPRNIFDDQLTYCDDCRPANYTWVKVVLICEDPEDSTKEGSMEKLLQVVHQCSCTTCQTAAVERHTDTKDSRKKKVYIPELLSEQRIRTQADKEEKASPKREGDGDLDSVESTIHRNKPTGHSDSVSKDKEIHKEHRHHKHKKHHLDG